MQETARVLGRMFDAIEYRGYAQETAEILGEFAGVPVWNALTRTWRPVQMLADVLTMSDHCDKPLAEMSLCYLGDGRSSTANSLLVTGAVLGLDVRVGAPAALQPSAGIRGIAAGRAARSGARLLVTDDAEAAVADADFVYADAWLTPGEPEDQRGARIDQLIPYQVTAAVLKASGNPAVRFLHCRPARRGHGLEALEVTDEVLDSPASAVRDQAGNGLHTVKALMVATLGPRP